MSRFVLPRAWVRRALVARAYCALVVGVASAGARALRGRAPLPPAVAVSVPSSGWLWFAREDPHGLRLVVSDPQAKETALRFRWHFFGLWVGREGVLVPSGLRSDAAWHLWAGGGVPARWMAWTLPSVTGAVNGTSCTASFCPRLAAPRPNGNPAGRH